MALPSLDTSFNLSKSAMSSPFYLLYLAYVASLIVHKTDVLTWLPLHRILHPLAHRLAMRTHKIAGLGIDQYFSIRFSYPSWMILPFASADTISRKKALEDMEKIWTFASGGSFLLIPYVHETIFGIYP